ncbi:MAG: hypothetical protein KIS86_14365 [Devosia sp.]|nr:hypothetical protein [Devosia sp.]
MDQLSENGQSEAAHMEGAQMNDDGRLSKDELKGIVGGSRAIASDFVQALYHQDFMPGIVHETLPVAEKSVFTPSAFTAGDLNQRTGTMIETSSAQSDLISAIINARLTT